MVPAGDEPPPTAFRLEFDQQPLLKQFVHQGLHLGGGEIVAGEDFGLESLAGCGMDAVVIAKIPHPNKGQTG